MEGDASDMLTSINGSEEDIVGSFHGQLSSEKPFDRIFALGKVSSTLKAYEDNELNHMDKKLLKGFYSRSLNEYGYLARKRTQKGKNKAKTAKIDGKEDK